MTTSCCPAQTGKDHRPYRAAGPVDRENLGFWSYDWPDDSARVVSPWAGIQKKLGEGTAFSMQGCGITDTSRAGFAEAIEAANIRCRGHGYRRGRDMTGEAKSRSNIHLPGVQEELVRAIVETGKPVVVLISAGRPLVFQLYGRPFAAVLYTWWLGTEAGSAIADVLFGDYNPSGKLPISFPGRKARSLFTTTIFRRGARPGTTVMLTMSQRIPICETTPGFPLALGSAIPDLPIAISS